MAWQRSTGLHAGRSSPTTAMLGGMQGVNVKSQVTSKTAAARSAAAALLILLLPWTLDPLKRAEHRRPWRIGSEGGEAGCRSLHRQAMDGLSMKPGQCEKHREPERLLFRRSCRVPFLLVPFLWARKEKTPAHQRGIRHLKEQQAATQKGKSKTGFQPMRE